LPTREFSEWPIFYRSDFRATRALRFKFALVVVTLTIAGTWPRAARSALAVVIAVSAGLAVSALDQFRDGWQQYLILFISPLPIGVVWAIFNTPRAKQYYSPGTNCKFILSSGRLLLELSGERFASPVTDLVRVHRFFDVAVLVDLDGKVLMVPWRALPDADR
jgi:hypothetical protein